MATSNSLDYAAVTSVDEIGPSGAGSRWGVGKRISFRFFALYFGLFCIATQVTSGLLSIPNLEIPDLATVTPLRQTVEWTASHIFKVHQALVETDSGSGDKTFDWVFAFCVLVFAVAGTLVWSWFDRRRASYVTAHKWFRVFLRFALGSQMLVYGFAKVFPMQMPFPGLARLLEPYGNFSPMGVLWFSVGASPAYERACGSAELLAGVLLLAPGLTMIGALICAAIAAQIFILNMTFDIPVKLFSFHLIAMAAFLLAPEFVRLFDFLILNRAVGGSASVALFRSWRGNRIALAVQIVIALWLIGSNFYQALDQWPRWGGGAPKSALYGIWSLDEVSIDGQVRSPLLQDYGRWRRIVFDSPTRMTYERMDDSTGSYVAAIDAKTQTIQLTDDHDKKWKGALHYLRPSPDHMQITGSLGSHPVSMQLTLLDRKKFLLVSRGFNWVQEYPFNR